ncbi:hypothetical protein PENSUB_3764 [Penicillium subrubescens]|uniref:Uncharacterized protein n=1 Tax=Penicillium subrubescens TaxID=1316194 RepID=A0A1Q5UEP4_9EURO|nr:hypothetical protein PENSUB_3764 [Penicillium subrubescens]
MCVILTQKYHICGCIWTIQDLYCTGTESCWGARILVINCPLQTCKECWRAGDKRVNQEVADLLAQQEQHRREKEQDQQERDQRDLFQYKNSQIENPKTDTDEEDFEALHPSRPTTPELDLNPKQMPRWLVGTEVMGDASRACEPVKQGKIWRDCRARREKTDWYLIEDLYGEWLGPTK